MTSRNQLCGDREAAGRGVLEKAAVGLRPRRGSAFPPLVCSHLGRLPREAPLTAARPIQVGLPTCPLLLGVLARHGETISDPGSSVKRKESRAERGQSSPPGTSLGGLEQRPACDAGPEMSHGLVLAGAEHQGCWASAGPSLHVTLPGMSRGTACEWLRTESGLMLLTS